MMEHNSATSASQRETKKEISGTQVNTLEKLRDTLLPNLISGEVRVAI